MKDICRFCYGSAKFKCGVCKSTYYCSKNCQKLHWKTHKLKCKPIVELPLEIMHLIASVDIYTYKAMLNIPIFARSTLNSNYFKLLFKEWIIINNKCKLSENLLYRISILKDDELILVNVGNSRERSHLHALARKFNTYSVGCNYEEFDINYLYKCKLCKTIYTHNELEWHTDHGFFADTYMGCYAKCYCAGEDEDEAIFYIDNQGVPDSDNDFQRFTRLNAVAISKLYVEFKQNKKFGKREKFISSEIEYLCDIRKLVDNIAEYKIIIKKYNEIKDKIQCPKLSKN